MDARYFLRIFPAEDWDDNNYKINEDETQIYVNSLRGKSDPIYLGYQPDGIFNISTQYKVFNKAVEEPLKNCLKYRDLDLSIISLGQTGSGKTHTMLSLHEPSRNQGIVPRLLSALIKWKMKLVRKSKSVKINLSFIENRDAINHFYDMLRKECPKVTQMKEIKQVRVTDRRTGLRCLKQGYRRLAKDKQGSSLSNTFITFNIGEYSKRTGKRKKFKIHCIDTIGYDRKDSVAQNLINNYSTLISHVYKGDEIVQPFILHYFGTKIFKSQLITMGHIRLEEENVSNSLSTLKLVSPISGLWAQFNTQLEHDIREIKRLGIKIEKILDQTLTHDLINNEYSIPGSKTKKQYDKVRQQIVAFFNFSIQQETRKAVKKISKKRKLNKKVRGQKKGKFENKGVILRRQCAKFKEVLRVKNIGNGNCARRRRIIINEKGRRGMKQIHKGMKIIIEERGKNDMSETKNIEKETLKTTRTDDNERQDAKENKKNTKDEKKGRIDGPLDKKEEPTIKKPKIEYDDPETIHFVLSYFKNIYLDIKKNKNNYLMKIKRKTLHKLRTMPIKNLKKAYKKRIKAQRALEAVVKSGSAGSKGKDKKGRGNTVTSPKGTLKSNKDKKQRYEPQDQPTPLSPYNVPDANDNSYIKSRVMKQTLKEPKNNTKSCKAQNHILFKLHDPSFCKSINKTVLGKMWKDIHAKPHKSLKFETYNLLKSPPSDKEKTFKHKKSNEHKRSCNSKLRTSMPKILKLNKSNNGITKQTKTKSTELKSIKLRPDDLKPRKPKSTKTKRMKERQKPKRAIKSEEKIKSYVAPEVIEKQFERFLRIESNREIFFKIFAVRSEYTYLRNKISQLISQYRNSVIDNIDFENECISYLESQNSIKCDEKIENEDHTKDHEPSCEGDGVIDSNEDEVLYGSSDDKEQVREESKSRLVSNYSDCDDPMIYFGGNEYIDIERYSIMRQKRHFQKEVLKQIPKLRNSFEEIQRQLPKMFSPMVTQFVNFLNLEGAEFRKKNCHYVDEHEEKCEEFEDCDAISEFRINSLEEMETTGMPPEVKEHN